MNYLIGRRRSRQWNQIPKLRKVPFLPLHIYVEGKVKWGTWNVKKEIDFRNIFQISHAFRTSFSIITFFPYKSFFFPFHNPAVDFKIPGSHTYYTIPALAKDILRKNYYSLNFLGQIPLFLKHLNQPNSIIFFRLKSESYKLFILSKCSRK